MESAQKSLPVALFTVLEVSLQSLEGSIVEPTSHVGVEVNNLPLRLSRVDELNQQADAVFEGLVLVAILVSENHIS